MKTTAKTKKRFRCTQCHSEDVRRNADCVWDVKKQSWEVVALFDSFSCEACGRECNVEEVDEMKKLTQNQIEVLTILRKRGAVISAAATERAWRLGRSYYLDDRNGARKGIVRKFIRGNKEATGR